MKRPTGGQAKSKLRTIVGGANYYCTYIEQFSEMMEPLNRLLGKGINVVDGWGQEQDTALANVKEKLITAPVLAYPDPSKPFILKTDASKNFIGHVLSQTGPDGKDNVVE